MRSFLAILRSKECERSPGEDYRYSLYILNGSSGCFKGIVGGDEWCGCPRWQRPRNREINILNKKSVIFSTQKILNC